MARVVGVALLVLTACSELANLGDERRGAPADAGIDALVAPDADVDGDAEIDVAVDTAPEVDASADLLFHADAEAPGADCLLEEPPLAFNPDNSAAASCGYTSALLAGTQSIAFDGERSVVCDPCWEGRLEEVWFEAVVQTSDSADFAFDPIAFVTDAFGSFPLLKRRTGIYVDWVGGTVLEMKCTANHLSAGTLATTPGQPYVLTVHYDWGTDSAEAWLREAGPEGKASGPRGVPDLTLGCPPDPGPTGWFAESFFVVPSASGLALMDEIRIAKSALALDNP